MEKIKDAVIVISGGMDSMTMLYEYKDEIALAVSFDYGSNHNAKEIPFAKKACEELNIPHISIPLSFMKEYYKSSLLEGSESIPEGHYQDDNMKSTVVPFRNGVMLAIVAGLAESNSLKRLMIANHGGDHAIYPDCRSEFINSMSDAISNGTYDNIKIFAPYTHITKSEIASIGKKIGIDYTKTWSCYRGNEFHCGRCGTCIERKEAMKDAGIDDKTIYED